MIGTTAATQFGSRTMQEDVNTQQKMIELQRRLDNLQQGNTRERRMDLERRVSSLEAAQSRIMTPTQSLGDLTLGKSAGGRIERKKMDSLRASTSSKSQLVDEASRQLMKLQNKVEKLKQDNINDNGKIPRLEQLSQELERRVSALEARHIKNKAPTHSYDSHSMLLVGGMKQVGHISASVSVLGASSDCTVASFPTPVTYSDSVTRNDGNSIVCGGGSYDGRHEGHYKDCYTFTGDNWEFHSSFTEKRSGHSMVSVPKGVYSFGGHSINSWSSSEVLLDGSPFWTPGPNIPGEGVYGSCAVAVNDSVILIAGGEYDTTQVRLYNVYTDQWSSLPSLPYGVWDHDCILTPNGVLLSGGMSGGTVSGQTILIDLTSGQSNTVGSLIEARVGHKMVEYGASVVALGGWNGDRILGSMEEWHPETQTWISKPDSIIKPRCYFSVMNVPVSTSELCD